MTLSLDDLRPSRADVRAIFDGLPSSAPGPDGVPFKCFALLRDIAEPIFYDIINGLFDNNEHPPDDFNFAFLICLAKSAGSVTPDGTRLHEVADSRPLSIVDASNRILASILQVALERNVASWISESQRGFLKGRHLLQNLLDVDFAAQKISIKTNVGAIILFDFRAAFPSLAHDFMWSALAAIGLPDEYLRVLKCFYKDNFHRMRVGGVYVDSVTLHNGVRQGCPLSPILFALCADILLQEISRVLSGDEVVRAFADDTAVVIQNYIPTLPILQKLFSEFEAICGLALNIKKTVLIPLWRFNCINVQRIIKETCPRGKDILVASCGKYLGFVIGRSLVCDPKGFFSDPNSYILHFCHSFFSDP